MRTEVLQKLQTIVGKLNIFWCSHQIQIRIGHFRDSNEYFFSFVQIDSTPLEIPPPDSCHFAELTSQQKQSRHLRGAGLNIWSSKPQRVPDCGTFFPPNSGEWRMRLCSDKIIACWQKCHSQCQPISSHHSVCRLLLNVKIGSSLASPSLLPLFQFQQVVLLKEHSNLLDVIVPTTY